MSHPLRIQIEPDETLPRALPGWALPGRAEPVPRRRLAVVPDGAGAASAGRPAVSEPRAGRPQAGISVLRPPSPSAIAAPLRLTRRGVVVVALAVAALGVALVWVAALSAPSPAPAYAGPARISVHPGDTLWSIAGRVAPQRDPQAEVATLQHLNRLTGTSLQPGQVLRVR